MYASLSRQPQEARPKVQTPLLVPTPASKIQARRRFHALALMLVALWLLPLHSGLAQLAEYRLSTGDTVRIDVFGEPDLSLTARIDDQGSIAYPLLGDLRVEGLTSSGLERLVTERLKGPYLVDPKVSVSIEEYREFYVMGQVNRPGGYPYSPGLTVRKAISVAGGFTDLAARRKLFVVTERSPEQERRVTPQTTIGPGDTLIVKESFF
jgi:protein involved in polysaccharide export with SLBB domain